MQFTEALDIVNDFGARHQQPALLETLQYMSIPDTREEMTGRELAAYRVVFGNMRKLFYGDAE